ncbi:hypothetical protein GJ496_003689 [Pomphorhynchus laevis]|nr:hypothetical protein GJ496_003689 [Pomphorhynchus laevis]
MLNHSIQRASIGMLAQLLRMSAAQAEKLYADFQKCSQTLDQTESQILRLMQSKTPIFQQLTENKILYEDVEFLLAISDNCKLQKKVGIILIPKEHDEAKYDIKSRITFLEQEIHRIDDQVKGIVDKRKKVVEELQGIESQIGKFQSATAAVRK